MEELTYRQYAQKININYQKLRKMLLTMDRTDLPGVIGFKNIGRNVILLVDKKKFEKTCK